MSLIELLTLDNCKPEREEPLDAHGTMACVYFECGLAVTDMVYTDHSGDNLLQRAHQKHHDKSHEAKTESWSLRVKYDKKGKLAKVGCSSH